MKAGSEDVKDIIEKKAILKVQNVSRIFTMGMGQECVALKDVSLTVRERELTILKGRSGSGKTTLINLMGALDEPDKGEITLLDNSLCELSQEQRDKLRRYELGFVFQSVALIPIMSAYENVDFALRLAGYKKN